MDSNFYDGGVGRGGYDEEPRNSYQDEGSESSFYDDGVDSSFYDGGMGRNDYDEELHNSYQDEGSDSSLYDDGPGA